MRIDTSILKYENVRQALVNIRNTKRNFFGYSIEVFDFFVYGNINTVAPSETWMHAFSSTESSAARPSKYYQILKTDSSIEHISAASCASYLSALLPKGIESISIRVEPTDHESEESKSNAVSISKKLSLEFRKYIDKTMPKFMKIMNCLVRDYVDYGNCSCLYEKRTEGVYLKHIPFKHSYFWSSEDDATWGFMYEEGIMAAEFMLRYPNDRTTWQNIGSINQQEILLHHFYTNNIFMLSGLEQITDELLAQQIEKLSSSAKRGITPPIYHVIIDTVHSKILEIDVMDYNPILTASNNTMAGLYGAEGGSGGNGSNNNTSGIGSYTQGKSNLYGRGAGIQALSSIIHANFDLQMKDLGSILTVNPASMVGLGAIVNANTDCEGFIAISPGKVNTIQTRNVVGQPVGDARLEFIGSPGDILSAFNENFTMHLKQVETSYNTEIFSIVSAPNQTATEVIERQGAAIRQFRGLSSPFYDLLRPLLEIIFEHSRGVKDAETPKTSLYYRQLANQAKEYEIHIFSFEDEQYRELKAAKLERHIANLIQLASAGVEIPDLASKLQQLIEDSEEANLIL